MIPLTLHKFPAGGYLIPDGTVVWIIDDARDGTPVGMVRASLYLPDGYIKANGATVLRADYPRLVNLADKHNLWTEDAANYPGLFGVGDGLTTFSVPDYRGYFDRYLDDGRGIDNGRLLGSNQDDDNKEHSHGATSYADVQGYHSHTYLRPLYGSDTDRGTSNYSIWSIDSEQSAYTDPAGSHSHNITVTIATSGGAESRPKNIARLAVIKY